MQYADPGTEELLLQFAAEIGNKLAIEPDWINTQVKGIMLARPSSLKMPGLSGSNLTVLFAKPSYLLSMKCQSMRVKDLNDIATPIRFLNIQTQDELKDEIDRYGNGWAFIGNDEYQLLKLTIAWAFPGKTPYDGTRLKYLSLRKG